MNFVTLLLITLSTLVLRTGERIEIRGDVQERNGWMIFRGAGGSLYSIPISEIDQEATRAVAENRYQAVPAFKKFKVSPEERDRLLRELEKNHAGVAAPPQRLLEEPPPLPTRAEVAADQSAEWEWRRKARLHEEAIRRAKENLSLLLERIDQLNAEVLYLFTLGFKPRQFEYQTAQLTRARESVPYAELEVTRAQRAWDQFRDDARRQGILPGWLR